MKSNSDLFTDHHQSLFTLLYKRIIFTLKKVRESMPRYYHGKTSVFEYKARAIGWRNMPILRLFPYFTGDIVGIKLSLKPLAEGQEWEQGLINIKPPDLVESELSGKKVMIPVSDVPFAFVDQWQSGLPPKYKFKVGEWWTRTISLKGGVSFSQPSDAEVELVFQNTSGKLEQTSDIIIAEFGVVSRDSALLNIFGWGITTILALAAFVVSMIVLFNK